MGFYVISKYTASGTGGNQEETVDVVLSVCLDAPSLFLSFCDCLWIADFIL